MQLTDVNQTVIRKNIYENNRHTWKGKREI